MPILQAVDGKFYDVPDDKAAAFEVPREKVKDLLESSGAMTPQGGPDAGPGPEAGGAPPGSPIVFQIFTSNGGGGGYGAPAGGGQGGPAEVNPYWWWRNMRYGPYWRNTWANW